MIDTSFSTSSPSWAVSATLMSNSKVSAAGIEEAMEGMLMGISALNPKDSAVPTSCSAPTSIPSWPKMVLQDRMNAVERGTSVTGPQA